MPWEFPSPSGISVLQIDLGRDHTDGNHRFRPLRGYRFFKFIFLIINIFSNVSVPFGDIGSSNLCVNNIRHRNSGFRPLRGYRFFK
ncbi:hypothetical protein GCWU000341_02219 [Oribacterium sp. oral taxon 078 str. F0262]|nr:hypothetical protein GCWU000341_02219 [Oribacterium sp. oral taxon 078 str. F0262]